MNPVGARMAWELGGLPPAWMKEPGLVPSGCLHQARHRPARLSERDRASIGRPAPARSSSSGSATAAPTTICAACFPITRSSCSTREIAAHPACIPPADHVLLGDFRDNARHGPGADRPARHPGTWRFSAAPTRSGPRRSRASSGPALDPLLEPGAFVVSDQPMSVARWQPLPPPAHGRARPLFRLAGRRLVTMADKRPPRVGRPSDDPAASA